MPDSVNPTPVDPDPGRQALLDSLGRAGRDISTRTMLFHAAIAERLGLNPTDHKALDFVLRAGPITAGQLAEQTGLTTGAVTGVIDRLEQAGFVRRESDPDDRRHVIIQPVASRAPEIARLFDPMGRAWDALYSSYSDADLAIVLDFLTRGIALLREETTRLRGEAPGEA